MARLQHPLAKFDPGEQRDAKGRWTGGGGAGPQRSLTHGESWQRIGSKITELPRGYTGSTARELPADSFKRLSITPQVPKAVGKQAADARNAQLRQIIAQHRDPAIEQGRTFRRQVTTVRNFNATHKRSGEVLLPESVPRDVADRAYNFAALRALHQVGAHSLDYNLSDAQKAELEPLTHFIRHVERRLVSAMTTGNLKGSQVPYLKEFGVPFKDNRGIGVSVLRSRRAGLPVDRGTPRLRFKPQQQIIKLAKFDGRARVFRTPTTIEAAA